MRVLRIAPARQLALFAGKSGPAAGHWDGLPEQARAEVLVLLARMMARGVMAGDGRPHAGGAGKEAVGG
jgi:hypothetical protein